MKTLFSITASIVFFALCVASAFIYVACSTVDPDLPGTTTPAPFLAFTNGSAYLLGHPVTSNQVYSAALAGSTLGAQLLIKDSPGSAAYLSDAQLVIQSIANSGIYNQGLLQSNLASISLKNPADSALLSSLASTAVSLAGVYINPLLSSDTNSEPFVKAALEGLAQGL